MRYNVQFKDNHFLTPTTYTQELSEYVQGLRYEDIPAQVVERAKMMLIRVIGAALAARDLPAAQKAWKMALEANGGNGGPIPVWGSGRRMSAINAALAMGTMADAMDWEDCSATGNPSAGVIPCAWIAATERRRSGRDLIAAIVAGYEACQRIALAVQPSDEQWNAKGWGLTSWQVFAALLPACKAYGLDARKINQAIGMASEHSVLPTNYHAVTLSDFKHYEYGYRARDGILIAKSVEKGIHNNLDGLDVPTGYTGTMCGNAGKFSAVEEKKQDIQNDADPGWLTRDLGKRYLLLDAVGKQWPTDLCAQAPAKAVSELLKEYQFTWEEVEEVLVEPATENRMWAPEDGFLSTTQAQFSIPYAVAAVLMEIAPANWYVPDTMSDPQLLALAGKVKAGPGPEDSVLGSLKQLRKGSFSRKTVTVTLKNGTKYTAAASGPAGAQDLEASVAWFLDHVGPVLGTDRLKAAAESLRAIEEIPDVAELAALLG